MNIKKEIDLTGENLKIEDIVAIARNGYKVVIPPNIVKRIEHFRRGLEEVIKRNPNKSFYGITTGCGDLKDARLKKKEALDFINNPTDENFTRYMVALEDYQERYIKAHNCGTGNPLPEEVVRAAIAIRLNSFAKGYSGVTLELVKLLEKMLNKNVTPWVLEEGSVGASGDLVPLAMIGATAMGFENAKAYYDGKLLSAKEALKQAGLTPIRLKAKEAMAITNGANFIAAIAALSIKDSETLLQNATIALALSLEAISGEIDAFSDFIVNARPHNGTKKVALDVRKLIDGSLMMSKDAQKIRYKIESGKEGRDYARVQDRYSFRCAPHVHGAAYEALWKLREIIEIEINSATDNPLIEEKNGEYRIYSGGNFHGQPLAVPIDYLKIALTGVSLISNKRIFSLLDRSQNFGLPADLAMDKEGGDTGLMIAQYAAAARAAESRIMSTPSSIMSISTAANQEDFVSMGMNGALHLRKVIHNTQIVISIEILTALRAIQIAKEMLPENLTQLGRGTSILYEYLNNILPKPEKDTYLRTDIERVYELVKSGELIKTVEKIW